MPIALTAHDKIARLYEDLGRDMEFVRQIVSIFEGEAEAFATAVAVDIAPDDLALIAHRFAGSSAQVASDEFYRSVCAVEISARDGKTNVAMLESVLADLPTMSASLRQWVAQNG